MMMMMMMMMMKYYVTSGHILYMYSASQENAPSTLLFF